jgi:hypothetical protein
MRLRFLRVYIALGVATSVGMGYFLLGDFQGGNATATVIHVYSPTAYTISFITADGTRCKTPHKWRARNDSIEVSDTFEVHYSKISPCDNVERVDDPFSRFGGYLIPPLLTILGLVAFVLVERQRRRLPSSAHSPTS